MIKSSFLCSPKTASQHFQLVSLITGFTHQKSPFKYLGVLIFIGKLKSIIFDGIITSIRNILHYWSSRFLLTGGKIILIRHVLNTIHFYLLQVLKQTKGLVLRLNKLSNSFLCDYCESHRIHWSSWEKMCFPLKKKA